MKRTLTKLTNATAVTICSAGIATLTFAQDEKPQRPGGGKGGAEFLKQIDTNADGNISKEEAGERWERMSRLDKDNDGVITKAEMAALRGGGKGSPGGKGGKGRAGMFDESDKNKDGKLTQDEVPEQAWERLSKADKNKDGAVSKEEIAGMMRQGMGGKGGKGRPEGGMAGMFDRFDKNTDGKLSKDEVPEQIWGRLSQADKDGDGMIAKSEMPQMGSGKGGPPGGKGGKGGPGGMGDMLKKLDKNADGKLAADEVPEQLWARLKNADTDADGFVSEDELKKLSGAASRGINGKGKGKGEGKGEGKDSDAPKPAGKKRPDLES